LADSHAHILEYGASRMMDLEGAKTMEGTQLSVGYRGPANDFFLPHPGCVAAVRRFILSHPDVKNDPSKFIEVILCPNQVALFNFIDRVGDGIIPHGL
jgi:hypothetical protein